MAKEIDKKVISIFEHHKSDKHYETDSQVIKCDDDIYCISMKHDKHGNSFNKDELIQDALETEYIVKVLIDTPTSPYINNYKVSGEKLLPFISKFISKKKKGQILEIDKYIPDDLA